MTRQIAVFAAVAGTFISWVTWTAVGSRLDRYVRSGYWVADLKTLTSSVTNTDGLNDAMIPEKMRSHDGRKVALEGFVEPVNAGALPMRSFTLVYDTDNTWGKPGPTAKVFGTASPGTKIEVEDISQEVRVLGTLHVGVQRDQKSGQVDSVFRIDADLIEPM